MIAELLAGRFLPKQLGNLVARATGLGSLAASQVEPMRFEMARSGRRFLLGNSAAITGIAPAATIPTTASQWVLWNADPVRTYAIETIGMYLTSGTPGVGGVLLGALFTLPAQIGPSTAGVAISSASNGGLASKAVVKSGVTITGPTAPNWYCLASNPSPNVAIFPGSTFLENRNLEGAIVIPPGQGFALAVVAPAGTTPLFAPFGNWIEVETDLE
jgi:hypothetical protein